MPVVDQSTDHAMAHLARRVADRPKLASALMEVDVDADALNKLPDTAFAWPEKRAYPIHDAGHALMSCVYREDVEGVPAHVDATLKEACEMYGIDRALFARPKVASASRPSSDYLLPEIRRLLVTEPAHVKTAEDKLVAEGNRLSVVNRALAAKNLVEKAAFHGVRLRPEIHKMAGFTVTDTDECARWIEARCEATQQSEYKTAFGKLAGAVRRLPPELRNRDEQVKIAEAISELDKLAGLECHYDRKLPDPLMTVFNTDKVAGAGVNLAGRFVPLERLAAYEPSFYADALGPDFVREASDMSGQLDPHKLAMVLGTLPMDMQRVLSAQIR